VLGEGTPRIETSTTWRSVNVNPVDPEDWNPPDDGPGDDYDPNFVYDPAEDPDQVLAHYDGPFTDDPPLPVKCRMCKAMNYPRLRKEWYAVTHGRKVVVVYGKCVYHSIHFLFTFIFPSTLTTSSLLCFSVGSASR
jgi:hypothetical protein